MATQESRRSETRRLLLAAATELFARNGYHATSVEAVAAAAERTTGALYNHFGGKSGLLVALLEDWIASTVAGLTAGLRGVPDLDGRLGAMWTGLIDSDGEGGDAWLLLEFELWLHAVRDPEIGQIGAERFRQMRAGLAGGLEDWSAEFGFELTAPADEVAAQLIALLVGMAFQHRLDPVAVPTGMVLAGLRRLLDLPARPGLPPPAVQISASA
ncbi:MAG: TetR/AcrR family transcriptional regulator [Microthrixaceae bacterium]